MNSFSVAQTSNLIHPRHMYVLAYLFFKRVINSSGILKSNVGILGHTGHLYKTANRLEDNLTFISVRIFQLPTFFALLNISWQNNQVLKLQYQVFNYVDCTPIL